MSIDENNILEDDQFGTQQEDYSYDDGIWPSLPPNRCSSPGTRDWEVQVLYDLLGLVERPINFLNWDALSIVDIPNYLNFPPRGYPQIPIHDCLDNNGQASAQVSKIPLSFADDDGHVFNTQPNNLSSNVSTQLTIPCPDVKEASNRRLVSLKRIYVVHLLMETELAFSMRNLINSTVQHAFSQTCSSTKSNNHNDQSFAAQATDCRENGCQSFQSLIPCGSSNEYSPCRVASVVCIWYLFEDLHQDFTLLCNNVDIRTSISRSRYKTSCHAEHSSPGPTQEYHFHGTLSLILFVNSEESPLGLFKIVHCPRKACFPSKDQGGPGPNKRNHREGDQSHNHKMLGNSETANRNNMPRGKTSAKESGQCKARNGSLSIKNLTADALAKTSQPPQNDMPCEEGGETSSMSIQKRKRLEKETGCMGEVTQFEEEPSEIQNINPKRQAVDFASKDSSCLSSVSGTIEGNNKGHNPNSKLITIVQLDAKSPQEESIPHNLQSEVHLALLDSFQQQSIVQQSNLKGKGDTGTSGQDLTIFELGNKQQTNETSKKTWGVGGSIGLEELKRQFGKKRKEAAASLDVSISTLKRLCRNNGIPRWPNKIKRDRLLISNLSSNETVPVAGGAEISISTAPTLFASAEFLVKSNQQKSWSSNQSLDNNIHRSLNDNVLRNHADTEWENIMIQEGDSAYQELLYRPQEFEPARDNLIPAYSLPDGPTILSPLPEERMPAKDAPGQKEAILSVEVASCHDFRNVPEPIQDQLISVDDMESTCIEAQCMPESKSETSIQNNARRMKLILEKLIMLPLEDVANLNHEASVKESLAILAGNLSLFADEEAKQILELKLDFPTIMYSWRDYSQRITGCQNFLAEFEKTKSLLETSTKEGEDIKDRYSELESKEKEMMAQLEAIQKEKNEISEQRSENFNQTKHLIALAQEQAGRTKEKELQITIATAKLNKLKDQWVSVQSSFI